MTDMEANGDAPLYGVASALRAAGFQIRSRYAPVPWSPSGPGGPRVPMPGGQSYVIVDLAAVAPADRPGEWHKAHGAAGSVVGFEVTFHESAPVAGGREQARLVARQHCALAGEVVSLVRDWSSWESTWSVTPVIEAERTRVGKLRRLAAAKLTSAAIPLDVHLDPLMLAMLTGRQVGVVHGILAALCEASIRWRFPRDKTGSRLAARTRVLLWQCAPPPNPAAKAVWLVVDGPAPRAEPRLTVRLALAVGKAAHHRWDGVPEHWRTGPRTVEQLWGVGNATDAAFVGSVTDTLLAGQTLDALRMCGVTVDRGTQRLLSGLPDCFELRQWTDGWVANATNLMVKAAPWRWRDAVAVGQRRQRLESLGGYNPNRRPGLFLELRDGRPHLTFDQVASVLVAPRVGWERDPDYDLVRLGLIARERIPMP
jgi:hypothetical protein